MVVRKLRLPLLYTALFFVGLFGLYLVVTRAFALRVITVVGSNMQLVVDQKRFPSTLLFFPSATLRNQLLAGNPVLSDVRFVMNYPHTLVIIPTLRNPAALLITPGRRVFVDGRGFVLSDADSPGKGLPQITAPIVGLRIGQQIEDQRIRLTLALLGSLQSFMPIETVNIADDGAITAHTGKLDILFTQSSDVAATVSTLQTLIAGFRIKGTLPTLIDLRFDKPIVKF